MRFLLFTVSLLAAEPEMVHIPAGEFTRGRVHSLPDDGLKWVPFLMKDDRPTRKIWMDEFWIDEHEVTNAEYGAFVKSTGHRMPYSWVKGVPSGKENHPVVNMSWADATAYAAWAKKRLPSEAEWERACRGTLEGAKYPWGDEAPTAKMVRFNVADGPGAVCAFPKTGAGLCDMAGNVWEWVADWYELTYYDHAPDKNPQGPDHGMYRVLRGGSWPDEEKYLTCANRSWARPAERSPNIGFRCAKNVR